MGGSAFTSPVRVPIHRDDALVPLLPSARNKETRAATNRSGAFLSPGATSVASAVCRYRAKRGLGKPRSDERQRVHELHRFEAYGDDEEEELALPIFSIDALPENAPTPRH